MNAQSLSRYRSEWFTTFGDLRREVLAGMVGTFALIPEVIAFSFVAGVDPEVGLFASFVIGIAESGGMSAIGKGRLEAERLTWSQPVPIGFRRNGAMGGRLAGLGLDGA